MNVVPVNQEPKIKYAQGKRSKPDQPIKIKRSRLSQSSMRISEPPTKPFELKNVELKIKNIIK